MKVFLFLYPYRQFFTSSNGYPYWDDELADQVVAYFGQAIDTRYRQAGYQICWQLFRTGAGTLDVTNLDHRLNLKPTDLLVDAGVTLTQLCPSIGQTKVKPIYADLPGVYSQLPTPIEEMWVGGFHRDDCVSKVARWAYYYQGLKGRVHVDEDLTNWGIYSATLHCDPGCRANMDAYPAGFDPFPITRPIWSYESLGFTAYPNWRTDSMWQRFRRRRNLQPWLVHS